MGLDFIDLACRVQRDLGVELELSTLFDPERGLAFHRNPPDLSMGELFDVISETAKRHEIRLSPSSWTVLCLIVADVGMLNHFDFGRETLLKKDLGLG